MFIVNLWWLWLLVAVGFIAFASYIDRFFANKRLERIAEGDDSAENSKSSFGVKIFYILGIFFAIAAIITSCLFMIKLFSEAIVMGLGAIFGAV
jgi:uncharacterized membrane protein YcjF (UPF0283 family)